jgi:fatty-acyl-CoA synthase
MVNLALLPLFHTGGLNVYANPAFHFGGSNVVVHTFVPEEALQVLSDPEVGITHFLGVPAHWLFMSQVPAFADATFPTLASAGVGGSPTPMELIRTWMAKGLPLQQAYGMTETSPMVTALTQEDAIRKIGSAGLPVLHAECRIVDEAQRDVEPGAVGELWVRGPIVTPGYWNRPEATEESITDGWLHTGDAARQDEEGYFYVVDRWKDMYVSGGENVYPAEVEDAIYQLPGIVEAAVIGVPDERWVEVGRAIIVRQDGATLDEAQVLRHCVERLAKYKVPKSVLFVDEIPHNPTGKVLKRELRVLYGTVPAQ